MTLGPIYMRLDDGSRESDPELIDPHGRGRFMFDEDWNAVVVNGAQRKTKDEAKKMAEILCAEYGVTYWRLVRVESWGKTGVRFEIMKPGPLPARHFKRGRT